MSALPGIVNTNLYFHIGLPKTGTTTIQHVTRQDKRINVVGTRYFNRFDYWEKPFDFLKADKVNLISEENQVLQMSDFGKFTLFLSRIRQFAPGAHIIVTIREQRALLESRYKYQFDWHGGYTKDFNTWLRSGQGMDYLSLCMYSTLYDTLLTFFPAGQIHFLLFEDLKNDFTGFFRLLYNIIGLSVPKELIAQPIVRNRSMSEPELRMIRRLNRFKLFRSDGLLSKYEFAAYRKIASLYRNDQRQYDEFRWEKVPFHKRIEEDFAAQNTGLVERNIFSKDSLEHNGYLLIG